MEPSQAAGNAAPPASFRKALALAALLVLVDAFIANQGVIAFLTGAWLAFITLPRALFLKRFAGTRPARLRNIAIGWVAVVLVFALNLANNRLARDRAQLVVAAVEGFHAGEKRYPRNLEELVPKYLDRVPLAKYTLLFNDFRYFSSGADEATLTYTALPPFGRPLYNFKRKRWGYID
jgi:hypothetical protein